MSSFSNGGPTIPQVPVDLPVPDVPPADFSLAMKLAKQGEKDSGFWEWLFKLFGTWIPYFLSWILGGLFGLFGVVVAWIMRQFTQIRANGAFGVQATAAAAVNDLFGTNVPSAGLGGSTVFGGTGAATANLAAAVLGSLGAGIPKQGDNSIPPGAEGAEKFMNTVVNLAVTGWLEGFLMEVCSAGFLKEFGELKDIVARVMGLGRLAHRAMGPAMKVYVEDPFVELLNQTFTPTKLAIAEAVRGYLRGDLTRAQLDTAAGLVGYSSDKVALFIDLGRLHLAPADIGHLVSLGHITADEGIAELQKQGYDQATASLVLDLQAYKLLEPIWRQYITITIGHYAAGKIDQATAEGIINGSKLTQPEIAAYIELARIQKLDPVARPSIAQGEQLVEAGLWNLNDLQTLQTYHGLNAQDSQDLELLTLVKMKKVSDAAAAKSAAQAVTAAKAKAAAIAATAKAAAVKAAAESKGVSISQFESLVKTGIKTVAEYSAFLTSKGIAPDNVTALTTELQNTLNQAKQATGVKATNAATLKAKNLSFAQLEQAVKDGAIPIEEYYQRIVAAGVSDNDAQILTTVLQDSIDAANTKAQATAAAKAKAAVKGVNLAQFETAVREGLKTIGDYGVFLTHAGYPPADVDMLSAELAAQVAKDAATAAKKPTVTATAKAKGLDLAQLEKSVRAGLKTMDDYRAALLSLGYDQADQDDLVSLLQLQVDHDQAAAGAAKTAATQVKALGVTLAEVEKAVVLGVVPMSTLTGLLARAKVGADETQILTLTVAAEAAKAAATRAKADAAAALVAKQGYTLSTLESDTIAGKLTMTQLTGILSGAGVPSADIADIEQLLQDQIDNGKAVATLTQSAAAKAAAKGLSLSEEAAAVKAGVKTIDDYSAFVLALGFDAADADTLTRTLGHEAKLPGY